jgi:hypothetical protein
MDQQIVELKAVTWGKDSHGLFDYEYSQYIMKRFQINDGVKIYRINDDVQAVQHFQGNDFVGDPTQSTEFLLSIKKSRQAGPVPADKYVIDVNTQQNHNHKKHNIYLNVRSLKGLDGRNQRGYELSTGDVIKLGRIEYRVAEIQNGIDKAIGCQINIGEKEFNIDQQVFPADTEPICRYCLTEQKDNNVPTIDNALMFCCDCQGSAGGVHFICLKQWIKNKIVFKTSNNTVTYQWKKLECEVCKKQLPRKLIFKGIVHELINIERPELPYIILEKIGGQSEVGSASTLSLIVPTDSDSIKLGRGHQCDLRISDISVSRIHAFLKFSEGKFLIYDNESKFGTLILLNKDYEIKNDKAAIQIGRTVFTFVQKTPLQFAANNAEAPHIH